MPTPAEQFLPLVESPASNLAEIAALLDGMIHPERVEATRVLGGVKRQKALWDRAAAAPPLALDDLIPRGHAALRPVRFIGKNSLAFFTRFEKRMCRPPADDEGRAPDELWGYNHVESALVAALAGPGYFRVRAAPEGSLAAVAIDYRDVPPNGCEGWPRVRDNARLFSRLVYHNLVDYLRRVSRDVFIGAATRAGTTPLPNYFILVREPVGE
ncbi:MAG: hypothetical protein HY719_02270 [Planctomycetes bacterium]|nr:hypothetical protein [Planctomycetota bacterium]